MNAAALLDKHRIADSFSRAALTYDAAAELQRQIGHQLLELLPPGGSEAEPGRVLDLGSGTGYFTPLLRQRFASSQLVSLDLAQGMLAYARQHRPDPHAVWVCGDAEALPLASDSLDLIFSSLAIQWCEQPARLFAEIARVLRPGGRFVVATLGPDTLHELRDAWARVDGDMHVNRFMPREQLLEGLPAGLRLQDCCTENRVLRYTQLRQLTSELKGIGAHNMNQGQAAGLTGKARVQAFKTAYEQHRDADGLLPATYQVYYLQLQKD
ncbi:malonyl-[acyl-carrier protein] O-methyltransferase BioC [Marinobacterium aestuarii]|uniref:Malonyl-[acyl-carrier protein] O-methyltransferase n=1 Tax=Marinobacterium aestuarii TaxID=1821621 RepID=A0A1A9EWE2_9GAMM|nr:malonyl-ACP O-methyltransferase BioC [Marinobacterium aestuarii]ANG61859.1 malonyl-[acyl-carrier protein] O-methyltransferase BioC [Marinobacterium aestuarii]